MPRASGIWHRPCCLLVWGSSGGGAGRDIILLVVITFPQYFNEQSSLESRRGRGDCAYADLHHRAQTPPNLQCPCRPMLPATGTDDIQPSTVPVHACTRPRAMHPPEPRQAPPVPTSPLCTALHGETIPTWVPYPYLPQTTPLLVDGAPLKLLPGLGRCKQCSSGRWGRSKSLGEIRSSPLSTNPSSTEKLTMPTLLVFC